MHVLLCMHPRGMAAESRVHNIFWARAPAYPFWPAFVLADAATGGKGLPKDKRELFDAAAAKSTDPVLVHFLGEKPRFLAVTGDSLRAWRGDDHAQHCADGVKMRRTAADFQLGLDLADALVKEAPDARAATLSKLLAARAPAPVLIAPTTLIRDVPDDSEDDEPRSKPRKSSPAAGVEKTPRSGRRKEKQAGDAAPAAKPAKAPRVAKEKAPPRVRAATGVGAGINAFHQKLMNDIGWGFTAGYPRYPAIVVSPFEVPRDVASDYWSSSAPNKILAKYYDPQHTYTTMTSPAWHPWKSEHHDKNVAMARSKHAEGLDAAIIRADLEHAKPKEARVPMDDGDDDDDDEEGEEEEADDDDEEQEAPAASGAPSAAGKDVEAAPLNETTGAPAADAATSGVPDAMDEVPKAVMPAASPDSLAARPVKRRRSEKEDVADAAEQAPEKRKKAREDASTNAPSEAKAADTMDEEITRSTVKDGKKTASKDDDFMEQESDGDAVVVVAKRSTSRSTQRAGDADAAAVASVPPAAVTAAAPDAPIVEKKHSRMPSMDLLAKGKSKAPAAAIKRTEKAEDVPTVQSTARSLRDSLAAAVASSNAAGIAAALEQLKSVSVTLALLQQLDLIKALRAVKEPASAASDAKALIAQWKAQFTPAAAATVPAPASAVVVSPAAVPTADTMSAVDASTASAASRAETSTSAAAVSAATVAAPAADVSKTVDVPKPLGKPAPPRVTSTSTSNTRPRTSLSDVLGVSSATEETPADAATASRSASTAASNASAAALERRIAAASAMRAGDTTSLLADVLIDASASALTSATATATPAVASLATTAYRDVCIHIAAAVCKILMDRGSTPGGDEEAHAVRFVAMCMEDATTGAATRSQSASTWMTDAPMPSPFAGRRPDDVLAALRSLLAAITGVIPSVRKQASAASQSMASAAAAASTSAIMRAALRACAKDLLAALDALELQAGATM